MPGLPDLSQLPAATGQNHDLVAYAALNVPAMAAGSSYVDPVTGVTVWKLTSATVPTAQDSMILDYFESGPRISHPWGSGWQYTIGVMRRSSAPSNQLWLVDFDRQSGTFSNWRAHPDSTDAETGWGFSLDSSEPQMLYKIDGGTLRKWDTSTDTEVTAGVWPKDLSANLNGADHFVWLGHGIDARWFVMMNYGVNDRLVAFNFDTDTVIVRTSADFPNLDEPKMERNGVYVWVQLGPASAKWWNLDTDTVSSATTPSPSIGMNHVGTPRGFSAWNNTDDAQQLYRFPPTGAPTQSSANKMVNRDCHAAGHWVTQSAADTTQYITLDCGSDTADSSGADRLIDCGIGFVRLDGADNRLICHHYGRPIAHTDQYYKGNVWPQSSPDGRLVIFKSSMRSTTDRADTFLVEIPLGATGGGAALTAGAESAYLAGGMQPQTSPLRISKW